MAARARTWLLKFLRAVIAAFHALSDGSPATSHEAIGLQQRPETLVPLPPTGDRAGDGRGRFGVGHAVGHHAVTRRLRQHPSAGPAHRRMSSSRTCVSARCWQPTPIYPNPLRRSSRPAGRPGSSCRRAARCPGERASCAREKQSFVTGRASLAVRPDVMVGECDSAGLGYGASPCRRSPRVRCDATGLPPGKGQAQVGCSAVFTSWRRRTSCGPAVAAPSGTVGPWMARSSAKRASSYS